MQLFELVHGFPVACLSNYPDGTPIIADGVRFHTLDQLAESGRFARQVLEQIHKRSTDNFGVPDEKSQKPLVAMDGAAALRMLKKMRYPHFSDEHFAYFLTFCGGHAIDPHSSAVWAMLEIDPETKQQKIIVQLGIAGLRIKAQATGEFSGSEAPIFDWADPDRPSIPIRCSFTLYRGWEEKRIPFTAVAYWDDYYPGGERALFWDEKPHFSLEKIAEALALRRAFPESLATFYIPEELERMRSRPQQGGPAGPTEPKAADGLDQTSPEEDAFSFDRPDTEQNFQIALAHLGVRAAERPALIDRYKSRFLRQFNVNKPAFYRIVIADLKTPAAAEA